MFRVFHLAWSTSPATNVFVAGWRNAAHWLVDLLVHEHICCATSCELDEKRATKAKFVAQSRPALYFSQQLSSTRNKCFCCATSWSCKVKNGKHLPKLATKQCCPPSWGFLWGFCISYFAAFTRARSQLKKAMSWSMSSTGGKCLPGRFNMAANTVRGFGRLFHRKSFLRRMPVVSSVR